MIKERDGKPWCTSCMEMVPDVMKHMRSHGIGGRTPLPEPRPLPTPPEMVAHEDKLPEILKKASAVHKSDTVWQCVCASCQEIYDEVNKWYVDFHHLANRYRELGLYR